MPRTARLDAPGVLHHVMIRGIERRKISTLKNWYCIFIVTLLNFPEGTLFNRVNPIRAGIVNSRDELKSYDYCWHRSLMGKRKSKSNKPSLFFGCKGIRHVLPALARKLEMSIAGLGFAVERGELIAKKRNFMLIN